MGPPYMVYVLGHRRENIFRMIIWTRSCGKRRRRKRIYGAIYVGFAMIEDIRRDLKMQIVPGYPTVIKNHAPLDGRDSSAGSQAEDEGQRNALVPWGLVLSFS
jgi:hypothetical protein